MAKVDVATARETKAAVWPRIMAAGAVSVALGTAAVTIGFGTASKPPAGPAGSLRLTPIAQDDIPEAMETIAPQQQATVKEDIGSCKRLAARMTISPIPGKAAEASGSVQIKSGDYLSPQFAVGAYPVNVMVPMPELAPNLTGRLDIIGVAKNLRVELDPPLDLPELKGQRTQGVYWYADQPCAVKG